MNGFNVSYTKAGQRVVVFAPTAREAKALMVAALQDAECSDIGVRPV